jgi:acetyl-CoA synthetase
VLIEHPAVAEAAVVPAPDEVRLAVPKAYIALAPGHEPDAETARSILALLPRAPAAVAARAPDRVFGVAEDDLGQDPAGRVAPSGEEGGQANGAEWRDDMFPELKG